MRNRTYEACLRQVMREGEAKGDRTGTGTISMPGGRIVYSMEDNVFPLITTKRVAHRVIAEELFWFLEGGSNNNDLLAKNVHIWDEFAGPNGELGPIYGVQWRSWRAPDGRQIDQIERVMHDLKKDPDSRRLIVSAWNVADLHLMSLQPCHMQFQLYVGGGKLSIIVTQRSADMFLGVPFNVASYALLGRMMAQQVGLKPGFIIWNGGDTHVYTNHFPQVKTQLSRKQHPLPTLEFARKPKSIFDYTIDDLLIKDYNPHGTLKAPVAVGPTFVAPAA